MTVGQKTVSIRDRVGVSLWGRTKSEGPEWVGNCRLLVAGIALLARKCGAIRSARSELTTHSRPGEPTSIHLWARSSSNTSHNTQPGPLVTRSEMSNALPGVCKTAQNDSHSGRRDCQTKRVGMDLSCPERMRMRIGTSVRSSENGKQQRCSVELGRLFEKAVVRLPTVMLS